MNTIVITSSSRKLFCLPRHLLWLPQLPDRPPPSHILGSNRLVLWELRSAWGPRCPLHPAQHWVGNRHVMNCKGKEEGEC